MGGMVQTLSELLARAEGGDLLAALDLARAHLYEAELCRGCGLEVPGERDVGLAVRMLRLAADPEGLGVDGDAGRGYAWGSGGAAQGAEDGEAPSSAEGPSGQGLESAQFLLGMVLEQGLGCERSDAEAAGWLQRAAERGSLGAAFRLGALHHRGLDGKKPEWVEAIRWLRKAGEHGHVGALKLLADEYPLVVHLIRAEWEYNVRHETGGPCGDKTRARVLKEMRDEQEEEDLAEDEEVEEEEDDDWEGDGEEYEREEDGGMFGLLTEEVVADEDKGWGGETSDGSDDSGGVEEGAGESGSRGYLGDEVAGGGTVTHAMLCDALGGLLAASAWAIPGDRSLAISPGTSLRLAAPHSRRTSRRGGLCAAAPNRCVLGRIEARVAAAGPPRAALRRPGRVSLARTSATLPTALLLG